MKVVILAGGLGTRLAEETDKVPKPMVEIGGMPIVLHIMKLYSYFGLNEYILCLGYKGHVIKDYFNNYRLHSNDLILDYKLNSSSIDGSKVDPWHISLIDTGLETQTGGRIKRIKKYLGAEPFCLAYGDGVADIDIKTLIRFHKSHGKLATISIHQPPSRFGVVELEGDQVTAIREKAAEDGHIINIGFCVLEPEVIDYIDGDGDAWEQAPLQRLIAERQLMAFHHKGFWQPMDTLRDKQTLETLWRNKPAWKIWE
jgi:glucose-1-phosphate cytidylyltransferase